MDFKNLYSIFCFDISAQDEKLVVNGWTVIIEIEKDTGLKMKAYCCILEEKSVEILIRDGKMYSIQDWIRATHMYRFKTKFKIRCILLV